MPVVLTWLIGAAIAVGAIFYGLAARATSSKYPWREGLLPADYYDFARSSVALTGLLGASVAAGLAIRRQRSQESSVLIAANTQQLAHRTYRLEIDRVDREALRNLRDRYAVAAEQLGNSSPAVQLAGVYAMAALVDDWDKQPGAASDAQSCVDVLCAFFRSAEAPDVDAGTPATASIRGYREVRKTTLRVLASRLRDPTSSSSWCFKTFDFAGASFDVATDFSGCTFAGGLSFEGAHFDEYVNFSSVKIIGPEDLGAPRMVSFQNCKFTAGVDFTNLSSSRPMSFDKAEFVRGHVNFKQFKWDPSVEISFRQTTFAGADVEFSLLDLTPNSHLTLHSCLLRRGRLVFDNVTVQRDAVLAIEEFDLDVGELSFPQSAVKGTLRLSRITNESTGKLSLDEASVSDHGLIVIAGGTRKPGAMTFRAMTFEDKGSLRFEGGDSSGYSGPWPSGSTVMEWPAKKVGG